MGRHPYGFVGDGCHRQSQEGFDPATLYAYSLLTPDTAARVRAAFPVLGSLAGLAAEATVCAQLLQTVSRGDNLILATPLRAWSEELRRRSPSTVVTTPR